MEFFSNYGHKLVNSNEGLQVYTNDRKEYTFGQDLDGIKLKTKHSIMEFLKEAGEVDEATRIEKSMGKYISLKSLPERVVGGQNLMDIRLNYLQKTIDEYDNLDLNPIFQRGHVWTEEQQVKFVEYIVSGGKTSNIILNHPSWSRGGCKGKFVIVDGKQRLTALLRFMNDEIEAYGYKASEIVGVNTLTVRMEINELKTDKEVIEWYLELNDGGTVHTDEELNRVRNLLKEEL